MNPALAFGERISSLILRDAALLLLEPAKANNPHRLDTKATIWRPRAIDHANLVKQQLRFAKSNTQTLSKETKTAPAPEKAPVFRLTDLPLEIRDMVFTYAFTRSSGKKPKLLWALKDNKKLHTAAYKIYCRVNNFSISLKYSDKKRGVEAMGDEYLKLVRNLTIVVPKTTQQTTPFTSPILTTCTIYHLTLQVATENSLRITSHNIIPKFPQIHTLRVVIKSSKTSPDGRPLSRVVHMNSFHEAIRVVNKMLGEQGKQLGYTGTKQVWIWEARGNAEKRRFEMTILKRHTKFE